MTIAASVWAYPRLPAAVATHWNLRGEPDGFSSRLLASAIVPAVILFMTALLQVLPRIDPHRENYAEFIDVYWLIVNGILLFLGAVHVALLANGVGAPVSPGALVPIGIGLLFVLIGSYLGRVRSNWFLGIRTPWTLSSETVWRETHRLGGWLFVVGGLVMTATGLLHRLASFVVVVITIAAVAVVPVVWSYVLWVREERHAGH